METRTDWFAVWLCGIVIMIFGAVVGSTIHLLNEYHIPPTTEVCVRSHIKKIPVTQLDGTTLYVPAERCDLYKIVENK